MKFYNLKVRKILGDSILLLGHSIICGSCSYGNCSCRSFSMKDNDPQWCANCGHSRSYHFNG